MTDPHLPNKIATCTTVEELDALVRAFAERGEVFPAECKADEIRKRQLLETKRQRGAKR